MACFARGALRSAVCEILSYENTQNESVGIISRLTSASNAYDFANALWTRIGRRRSSAADQHVEACVSGLMHLTNGGTRMPQDEGGPCLNLVLYDREWLDWRRADEQLDDAER